jgi:hypothetical protein
MHMDYLNAFNPRDVELLKFLLLPGTSAGDSIKLTADQMMQAMNFAQPSWRAEPGKQQYKIPHACRLHCELLDSNNAVTARFTVVTPALSTLDVNTSTNLGIKLNADPAHEKAILNAFSAYRFVDDGPLPQYIAKVAADTGASPLAYALFFGHECTMVERKYDISAIGAWLDNYLTKDDRRARRYRVITVEWLADFPITPQGPNSLQVPLADAEKTVKQTFNDVVTRSECAQVVTQIPPLKIDELRLPDQIKVNWAWEYIELDCGGGFHFWKPTTYYRSATAVLYAVAAYPGNLDGAKKKIERIVIESAQAAAFYVLVSGDIATAITVFKELFVQKVIEALANMDRCLSAEIYVVTETGEWHT